MMMPGALHGRRAAGGIVTPPGYAGALWKSEQIAASGPVTSTLTAIWRSTGVWEVEGVYVPASGNWFTPTTVGAGAAYELRITATQTGGNGTGLTVANPAASWVSLSADRTLQITSSKPGGIGSNIKQFTMTVEIRRQVDGVVVSTATVFAEVNAEIEPG